MERVTRPAEARVLLVRHPETEANVTGRWVGRGNAPFSELGLAQVDAVATRIVGFVPDRLLSSPLERARVPATKAAEILGIRLEMDDRLAEMHFGAAEGLTFEEARAAGIALDFKAEDRPVASGGESRREILARTGAVLDEVLEGVLYAEADGSPAAVRDTGARVAFVTHGGVFRSALVHLLGLPIGAIWAFHIPNAGIAEITVGLADGGRWGRLEEFGAA